MRSRIAATGSYAPKNVITNDYLASILDTSDAWIVERTGIRQRRRADPDEATSDLCVKAARPALEMAGWKPEDLDLIVVGTISPDMPFPSCAAVIQAKLGAKNAFAFDVSAACAGSLFAMAIADRFIRTGGVRRALVLGSEMLSRIVNWKDRNTCVLFGDGAGAMLLEPADEADGGGSGILSTHLFSDGTQVPILNMPGGGSAMPFSQKVLDEDLAKLHMNGREVYKFAVRALEEALALALRANGFEIGQLDHVIAHQANQRMLEAVCKRLDIPLEKVWLNIERFGNTSSASLPTTLDEANRAGRLKRGDLIGMMAIGGGMTWGSAVVRW